MANNVDIGTVSWKIKAGASEASDQIKKLTNNISGLKKTLNAISFVGFIAGLRQIGSTISKFVTKTSDYIATMNQFNTVMGKSTEEATKFVNKAQDLLGLDPSQIMNSMTAFKSLAEGFGISSDNAYKMSKNLTQLAVDMSAFKNISFDLALEKIKSGFSGKVICLICKGLHIVTHLIAGTSKRVMT